MGADNDVPWVWVDGSIASWLPWDAADHKLNGPACVRVLEARYLFGWADGPCAGKHYYICENIGTFYTIHNKQNFILFVSTLQEGLGLLMSKYFVAETTPSTTEETTKLPTTDATTQPVTEPQTTTQPTTEPHTTTQTTTESHIISQTTMEPQTTTQPNTEPHTTTQPTIELYTTTQPTSESYTTTQPTTDPHTTTQHTTESKTTLQPSKDTQSMYYPRQSQPQEQLTTEYQTMHPTNTQTMQPLIVSKVTSQPTTESQTNSQPTTELLFMQHQKLMQGDIPKNSQPMDDNGIIPIQGKYTDYHVNTMQPVPLVHNNQKTPLENM